MPEDVERRRRMTSTVIAAGRQIEGLRNAFKERYGEELGEIATAYAIRGRTGPPSQTFFRGSHVATDLVRSLFSTVLIRELDKQPTETRSEWLGGFLEDLDIAVPR